MFFFFFFSFFFLVLSFEFFVKCKNQRLKTKNSAGSFGRLTFSNCVKLLIFFETFEKEAANNLLEKSFFFFF